MARSQGGGDDFGVTWSLAEIAPEAKSKGVYRDSGTMAALIFKYLRCIVSKKLAAPARSGVDGAVFSTRADAAIMVNEGGTGPQQSTGGGAVGGARA